LVAASDKNRLIRQLQREENPDVEEIMRRFKTDKEDFYNFEIFRRFYGLRFYLFQFTT
jgi:hypothetical protein